jgi:MFS family permease
MPFSSPRDSTNWPIVFLLVGAGVIGACHVGKVPAALSVLRADLGLSLVTAGWVLGMFNVIGLVTGMALGALADSAGHRRLMLTGLAALTLAGLFGALSMNGAMLLLSRLFEGFGFMMTVVAVPSLIVRASRGADQRLAFGIWAAYMPAGMALMLGLTPFLMQPFGWRGLWVMNAILAATFAVTLMIATRPLARTAAQRPNVTLATIWRDMKDTASAPGPLVLALGFGVYALQYIAVFGFLPTVMVEQGHLSPVAAAGLTAFAIFMNVPGNVLGGVMLHRGWSRAATIALASIVMGLCDIGIYEPSLEFWPRYALAVLLSFVGGIMPTALFSGSTVLAHRPQLVATTNGLIMQGSNLGQAIGPPAIAAMAASLGTWRFSPVILTSCAAIGVVLAVTLHALERRRSSDGTPRSLP